jgi:hypothetical protein
LTLKTFESKEERPANSTLPILAVQYSADTFVVKIPTFSKPQTVGDNFRATMLKRTDRQK